MLQKYDHFMICHIAETLLRNPERHQITKDDFFFSPLSLLCKFKLYESRLNHIGFLKLDKRDKLLKVNILSDAE